VLRDARLPALWPDHSLALVPASPTGRAKTPPTPAVSRSANGSKSASSDGPVDNVTRVYNELRALIISGQLPPGARIAERAVVDRMGLSRTPVRSALHRLQQEGLVASVGRAGDQRLIVTPLTRGDGREVFLIVGHLEGLAAREAASLPTEARKQLVRRLREVNKELSVASKAKAPPAKLFALDLLFHETYVEGVAGPRVVALHRAIKPQSERYARLYVNVLLAELPTSVKEHEAIATAIGKGDPRSAQHAVETNWHNAAARLSEVIAEHGERGIWHLWDAGADGASAKARPPKTRAR
jgi:DNA-binding GntR family transcriptional regulator